MLTRLRSIWTIPDLRNKILFTIAMLLLVRVAAFVPVPGVPASSISTLLSNNKSLQQFFGLLDVFSGGSFSTFSIIAIGVYPYITASIVVQLLQGIIPALGAWQREGEVGRNRLAQLTRYITVPLALLQAFGQMAIISQLDTSLASQFNLLDPTKFVPTLGTMLSLTAGTMFLVWMGELITENGIGNGISLIIFANIMVKVPQEISSSLISGSSTGSGIDNGAILAFLGAIALYLVMTFVMVYVYQAQRRVPVQYPTKRQIGATVRGGQETTYIPLQVNSAGMIPLIFASSILLLPVVIAQFLTLSTNKALVNAFGNVRVFLDSTNWWYWAIYGVLVFAFTYFYATVIWEQQNMAENLQKQGAFIPGIRPGPRTAEYLSKVLNYITFGGAVFLGIVAIAPAL
ncbi:MAG TPA: preprotein translocase subunit SecY, partial [Ktedonobacterales bacterium]|nr:preprotein translocase subunit SecY [Ktedonobacterales bacterium]